MGDPSRSPHRCSASNVCANLAELAAERERCLLRTVVFVGRDESVYQVGSKEHLMARAADPQGERQTYARPPREIGGATLCYK